MDVSVKLLELQAHKLWKKDKKTVVFFNSHYWHVMEQGLLKSTYSTNTSFNLCGNEK